MDAVRFDTFARALTAGSSRRTLWGVLAALGLAWTALRDVAEAKKGQKKRKKKPLNFNEFGCVNVGGKCRGKDSVCCSGICQGKKPKKGKKDKSKCVAHDVLDCPAGADQCEVVPGASCGINALNVCFQTTGQASFCSSGGGDCRACAKDVDCEPDFGPGAACIVCAICSATGNTRCSSPGV